MSERGDPAASLQGAIRGLPRGSRVVVRVLEHVDQVTGRPVLRDYVGHVLEWTESALDLMRDAAANGSRPAQGVRIPLSAIVALKRVPERPTRRVN